MTGEKRPRAQRAQPVERCQVRGDVALRVRDHRAPLAEDEVSGEDRAVFRDQKTQMVVGVPGCVQRRQVERSDPYDVAVAKAWVAPDRGVVRPRKALGEGKVIGVGVRDQHHADRLAGEPAIQGREVSIVVRAGVDDGDDRSGVDDPGVGARPGVWARVGRHDS